MLLGLNTEEHLPFTPVPETKEFLNKVVRSLPASSRTNAKITLKRNKKKGHAQLTIESAGPQESYTPLREADFRSKNR
jgi:hypothetical protein